jgi:uncharacterized SAM-binding protein YcdF (DUF218 family)
VIKLLKLLVAALLVLSLLLAVAFLFRAPLLRGAARAWIVNDPLTHADVIVVLGGGPETRPQAAAKLWHQGLAPTILLMNPQATEAAQLGLTLTEANLDRAMLLNKDVPTNSILIAPETVNSTYEESLVVRDWARTNAVHRVIIVTDVFHTRRAGWVFRKQLQPLGIRVEVDAMPVREYSVTNWWQHDQGIVAFQNEVLKYVYYRLKY